MSSLLWLGHVWHIPRVNLWNNQRRYWDSVVDGRAVHSNTVHSGTARGQYDLYVEVKSNSIVLVLIAMNWTLSQYTKPPTFLAHFSLVIDVAPIRINPQAHGDDVLPFIATVSPRSTLIINVTPNTYILPHSWSQDEYIKLMSLAALNDLTSANLQINISHYCSNYTSSRCLHVNTWISVSVVVSNASISTMVKTSARWCCL